jgi:uncharacterized protein YceK
MSPRSRQSAVALILLFLITALMSGCGSDSDQTTTTRPVGTTTTAAPSGQNGTEALIGTQLKTTEDTPHEYIEAVRASQPIVKLFYVAAGEDDQRVLENLESLQSEFPGYAFLLYDVADPEAYGDLSTLLKVDYPPAVILVDSTGTVDSVWNGFVDVGTLNQSLVNLGV